MTVLVTVETLVDHAALTTSEPAWDPRRLHTLEVRMERDSETPFTEAVPA